MSSFLPRGLRTTCTLSAVIALSAASAFAGGQPASISDPAVMLASTFPTCGSLCAVINSDGTVARAHPYTTATHLGTGVYQVLFYSSVSAQKNITKCAFLATPGVTDFNSSQPAAYLTVAGRAGTTNGVFIATFNAAGIGTDAPFHLLVTC